MKAVNILLISLLFNIQCIEAQKYENMNNDTIYKHTNKLINESSPYLLQHAHNPVNWYAWGDEALEKAKKEDKILIISIGYSACHWCHVMEHETFENEIAAKIMNDNFVCIKVDREERPDIDQIYMDAVQVMTGSGGWPLNCFALPNGQAIYGGTYFKTEQWIDVLEQISSGYINDKAKFVQSAEKAHEYLKKLDIISQNKAEPEYKKNILDDIFINYKSNFDTKEGGFNRAPKFPLPNSWEFILKYYHITKDEKALEQLTLTLDKMAYGGIYDQIGGGFARYSTDIYWKAPHFEKMLYDNAQLITLYSMAYQITEKKLYKTVVYKTLEFIQNEMTSPENGFYSSYDADSEGVEGKFYVWTESELNDILKADAQLFKDVYSVTKNGNWEHGNNILHITKPIADIIEKHDLSKTEFAEIISSSKYKLMKVRDKRIKPGLDDKILTSWNALMLKGYVDAYIAFDNNDFLKAAIKNAEFIQSNLLTDENRIYRNYKNNKISINGFLDDYAFTIEAFISLYQATFNEEYLLIAKQLMDYTITHFYDKETGMFFYTSDIDAPLVRRKIEVTDNVIPSANSTIAKNLYSLGVYFYNDNYQQKSKQMLDNVLEKVKVQSTSFSKWSILMFNYISAPYEIVITGRNADKMLRKFNKLNIPNTFIAGSKTESNIPILEKRFVKNQTTIYICRNKICLKPVTEFNQALKLIE